MPELRVAGLALVAMAGAVAAEPLQGPVLGRRRTLAKAGNPRRLQGAMRWAWICFVTR
ncbi:MAG: hypothetical protein ACE369_11210 [Roseovarius sp.]